MYSAISIDQQKRYVGVPSGLMVACSSTTERKTRLLSRLCVSLAKKSWTELNHLGRHRQLARKSRFVAENPIYALAHEALLPASHGRFGQSRSARDFAEFTPLFDRKDDPRTRDVFLRVLAIPNNDLEPTAVLRCRYGRDPCSHSEGINRFTPSGNPLNGNDPLA